MTFERLLAQIAREHLGIETLRLRNRDRLDFHEVYVGAVRRALEAAWHAGAQHNADEPSRCPRSFCPLRGVR